MKYLKKFNQYSEYETFKTSENFIIPNVSWITSESSISYHGHPILTATYDVNFNETDDVCWNNGENILRVKIDGVDINFDPEITHLQTNHIKNDDIQVDYGEGAAIVPSNWFVNGNVKSWTLIPKDQSFSYDEMTGVCLMWLEDDIAYLDLYTIDNLQGEEGDFGWFYDSNTNGVYLGSEYTSWYSGLPCAAALFKFDPNTQMLNFAEVESNVEYTTGGAPNYYVFDTEGKHEVIFTLYDNTIPDGMFDSVDSLLSIGIDSRITSIGNWSFYGCSNLNTIVCKAKIAPSIMPETFWGVMENGKLIFPEESDYSSWLSKEEYYLGWLGWNGLVPTVKCTFNVETTTDYTWVLSAGGVIISKIDGKEIDMDSDPNLINMEGLGYRFNSVGEHVVEFVFPTKEIGANSFSSNNNLVKVEIEDRAITTIWNSVFSHCENLKSISLPNSIVKLGNYVFRNCIGLESVVIPESITEINYRTFRDCTNLTSIVLPNTLTFIDREAFYGCSNLKEIKIDAYFAPEINSDTFAFIGTNGKLIYPNNANYSSWLNTDYYYLGYYGWNLDVENYAYITATYDVVENQETKLVDDQKAFSGIMEIEGEILPLINRYSFKNSGEQSVKLYLRNSTTTGESGFNYCKDLVAIELPETITTIGKETFRKCDKLRSVNIPSKLTTIGSLAFCECAFTSIVLPETTTFIDEYAFSNSNLTEITCYAKIAPTITNLTFNSLSKNGVLKYPAGSDYSQWLNTTWDYLGYRGWTGQEI